MAYTPYVSQLLLEYLFTATAVTRPTSWTVALYTADPEGAGVELTDANYVAQAATFSVADADANSRFEASNVAEVQYPAMAAAATVAYAVVKDQAGSQLAALALNVPRNLEAGDVFSIPVGELVIKGENV